MKKHKNIMIQGTGSSVGKTLIVAGLCRVFAQDGYRVSPFKSQNMALNSFVDIEGLELSRGTVIQAEAGYEIPRAFMNPILLKPNSDNNSQVIINAKVVYTADAKNYFLYYFCKFPKLFFLIPLSVKSNFWHQLYRQPFHLLLLVNYYQN